MLAYKYLFESLEKHFANEKYRKIKSSRFPVLTKIISV